MERERERERGEERGTLCSLKLNIKFKILKREFSVLCRVREMGNSSKSCTILCAMGYIFVFVFK